MIPWLVRSAFLCVLSAFLWAYPKMNHGFRINKLVLDHPSIEQAGSLVPSAEISSMLAKPFRYIGHGGQAYVFVSKDESFVLKLFRKPLNPHPWRMWMRRHLFGKNPRVAPDKKLQKLLISSRLSCEVAPDLTGVFFAHLSQTSSELPVTLLIDRLGRKHSLDLNRCRFVLQKKGVPVWTAFSTEEKGKAIIEQFVFKVHERVARKLRNHDVKVSSNFGLIGGEVVEWDIGNFIYDPSLENPKLAQEEMERFEKKMRRYLLKNAPSLLPFFEEAVSR